MTTRTCPWCGRLFTVCRSGGAQKRFCSSAHRHAFWTAARRYVAKEIETGRIRIEALKALQSTAHAVTVSSPA
jgi:hypothetical protein